jgi:hypothetical protein
LPDNAVVVDDKPLYAVSNIYTRFWSTVGAHEDIALKGRVYYPLDAGKAGVPAAAVAISRENDAVVPKCQTRAKAKVGEITEGIDELAALHKDIGNEPTVEAFRPYDIRVAKPRHEVSAK